MPCQLLQTSRRTPKAWNSTGTWGTNIPGIHSPLSNRCPVLGIRVHLSRKRDCGSLNTTRPIIMQLDLRSVEKVPFSTLAWPFASKKKRNVGNLSSSPQNDLKFSPRSIQSCFPLLKGPSSRKSPSAIFYPTGSNTTAVSDRIENNEKKTFFRSDRVL